MALKRDFTEKEAQGFTEQELKTATKYLRKNKTAGAIPRTESFKLHELFMVGASFRELKESFPQYDIGQILMTAALQGWIRDRDNMMWTLQDRIKARILKSFIGQVDFITTLLEVNNAEVLKQMREYIIDPVNNKPPENRITNLKEYREICELLLKLGGGTAKNPMLGITNGEGSEQKPKQIEEKSAASLLNDVVDDG